MAASTSMDAAVFGLMVADVVAEGMDLRNPPPPGGLSKLRSILLTSGGNACNVSIAMAKLGMSVAAAGMVGDDSLGAAILQCLRQSNVDSSHVLVNPEVQTSATIVAVEPGGERCFFHTGRVSKLIDAPIFRRSFDLFRRCRWLQIGYFGLLPALTEDLPQLLGEFRAMAPNTKIALDTVNPPADRKYLDPILPHVDLFAPSRPEALLLTGEQDPPKMVASFRKQMTSGLIGIKLDADGCYLDDGVSSLKVPAYRVRVTDTTGAGDTWFAGLICGLGRAMSLQDCGRLANRVAADCCTELGATAGVRSLDDTLKRL